MSPRAPSSVPSGLPFQKLAVYLVLAAETMAFGGLISAFLVFRLGQVVWPPLGQPRFPAGFTALNTLALVASAITLYLAIRAIRSARPFKAYLVVSLFLGSGFLVVQGFEWLRLIQYGLTASSGIYAGLFYIIIGFHALHVAAGLVALLWLNLQATRGFFTADSHMGMDLVRIYWNFVVGVWPLLYVLVYLS